MQHRPHLVLCGKQGRAMATNTIIVIILSLYIFKLQSLSLSQLNSSFRSHPLTLSPTQSLAPPQSNSFIDKVFNLIAAKERWNPNADFRILKSIVQFGNSNRYEFKVRFGKKPEFLLKFEDKVDLWKKSPKNWEGFEEELVFDEDLRDHGVRDLEFDGPVDLRADNQALELVLPSMNARHGNIKRIIVGKGITIKVDGATEATLFHPHDIGLSSYKSSLKPLQNLWSPPSCYPSPSLQVSGPASVVAYHTRNPRSHVETLLHHDNTVELVSNKCYGNGDFKKAPLWIHNSLNSKLQLLEKSLESFLGKVILQSRHSRLLKAKVTSLSFIKLRLEIEREITENDRVWKRVEEWRTKPKVERVAFEIVVRVIKGNEWKIVTVKKLIRSIMAAESSSWSNLMSNVSFTQMSNVLLPPEALTLDVDW